MGFPLPPEGGRGVWGDTRQKSHYRPPLKPPLSMGFSKIPSKATPDVALATPGLQGMLSPG